MIRVCGYKECGKSFDAKTHNQRYCTSECCRLATNARIMENYYERKARRQGFKRVCRENDCETELSRYNDDTICQRCASKKNSQQRAKLLQIIS